MTDTFAVELRGVSKAFAGGVKAVDQVDLQIRAGQVVALLGPSGCGKTTTLRLINRLEEATGGEVFVRGQDVRGVRPEALRRSIGYVIQEGGLLPHLTVAANVGTVPRLLGWDRSRIRARVAQVLELVGLPEAEYGRRQPTELSGGQRQRVGVARALAADPDLLLMDEPFGALDPGTREAIQDEFLLLNARLRKTVVLITHDIAEAARLADEIVLMDKGQIVQRGSLHELLISPADDRVRAFLGRRVQELALGVIPLSQVVEGLRAVPPSEKSLRLRGDLPLGQVLVTLADAPKDASLVLDGKPEGAYSVREVLARILTDLKGTGERDAGITPAEPKRLAT
jgi:osmoprotectant transport system ATP-binding protein